MVRLLDEGHAAAAALVRGAEDDVGRMTERRLEEESPEGVRLSALLPGPLPDARVQTILEPSNGHRPRKPVGGAS